MRWHTWLLLVFVPLLLSASSRAGENAPSEEEAIYQGKSMADWIGDLKDLKNSNRPVAVQTLGVFGPKKEIVSALAAALKDDACIVAAAQTLGQFGSKAKEALPALRTAFKILGEDRRDPFRPLGSDGSSGKARRAVAEAIILIDDKCASESAPILLEALKIEDADKRRGLILRLRKLGPDAAKITVPALIAILTDTAKEASGENWWSNNKDDPRVKIRNLRLEAVKSLGRIGPAAKLALQALTLAMKSAAPDKNGFTNIGPFLSKPGGPTSALRVGCSDTEMLAACAEALGRIRSQAKGTVSALRLSLRDLDEGVRWSALCALLASGQDAREVVPILLNLVGDKDAEFRRVTVQALGLSGSEAKEIVPALTAALKDKDASVRHAAVQTLGEMGSRAKSAAPALIAALKDADAKIRREAVKSLCAIDAANKTVIVAVRAILHHDASVEARQEAANSLGKIAVTDKDAMAALIAALRDNEEKVVSAAAQSLAPLGAQAKAAIPSGLELVQSTEPNRRLIACFLLGSIGSAAREAIVPLEKMSQEDAEEWVRLAALTTLAKIDSTRLKDTVRRLTAALESKEEKVFQAALNCLSFLGPDARDALPALRSLQKNRGYENDFSLHFDLESIVQEIDKPKEKLTDR